MEIRLEGASGERHSYQRNHSRGYFEGIPSYVIRQGRNESFYTRESLGLLATMPRGKVTIKRDGPYQRLSRPLGVGKEWRNTYVCETIEEKSSQTDDLRMVVRNVEAVKIPAGNFETFKIEVYNVYDGSLLGEYRHSPRVKWFVKMRDYRQDGVYEEELRSLKS